MQLSVLLVAFSFLIVVDINGHEIFVGKVYVYFILLEICFCNMPNVFIRQ
jgi:hypothetical protein